MVSKMVPIACTVCMHKLLYPLFKSCMCGTARNFDSIVTIICIYLDMGPKTIEFKFGPFRIYSVCGMSNTSLDGNPILILLLNNAMRLFPQCDFKTQCRNV